MALYLLSNKINKDCLKIIHQFMWTTKKQMTQWLIEHREKSNCSNKYWWKSCKYTHICDIYKLGYLYIRDFKEEKISFYKYLKNKRNKYNYFNKNF